jgi:hypothetical protein
MCTAATSSENKVHPAMHTSFTRHLPKLFSKELLVHFLHVVYFPPSASYRKDTNYETPHYIISAIPMQYII